MSKIIDLPAPVLEVAGVPPSKWEREHQAFRQMLPQLLGQYHGQFVAIHEGKVVDHGSDKLVVALRVLAKVGNVPIHVGLVSEEPEHLSRSGVRRDLRVSGGAF